MKKRKLSFLLSSTIVCAMMAGCTTAQTTQGNSSSTKKVKLNMLYNNTDEMTERQVKYVMDHLPDATPNIEVELDFTPGDVQTFETKVRTTIAAGGDGVDVWWERGGSFATPILKGNNALQLDSYLEKNKTWDKTIQSAKSSSCADDGHFYVVPYGASSYELILYNKKIFNEIGAEVPKTVTELKEVIKKLKQTDYVPISVGGKDGWCAAMMIEGFAYSIDPYITKKVVSQEAKFSDDPYKKGTEVMKELLDMGAFTDNVALTGIDEALPLFESGKAAMMANGSWAVPTCAKKMGDDFGFFYYPVINDADVEKYGKNVAGGIKQNAGMMAYAGTKHPEEAATLCMAVAELSDRFQFEEEGNPFTVFDAEKNGWKRKEPFASQVTQLANDMKKFEFSYGFVQDVMPTAAGTTKVMSSTSKFMTNSKEYTIDNYLSDLDSAVTEE